MLSLHTAYRRAPSAPTLSDEMPKGRQLPWQPGSAVKETGEATFWRAGFTLRMSHSLTTASDSQADSSRCSRLAGRNSMAVTDVTSFGRRTPTSGGSAAVAFRPYRSACRLCAWGSVLMRPQCGTGRESWFWPSAAESRLNSCTAAALQRRSHRRMLPSRLDVARMFPPPRPGWNNTRLTDARWPSRTEMGVLRRHVDDLDRLVTRRRC